VIVSPDKARLFDETARVVCAAGAAGAAPLQWFVPGRIEVLGKHTDYAGGRSLLCAVERGFCVSASPRTDNILHVTDVLNHVEAQFIVSPDQPHETRWRNYPATVARRVARNFPPISTPDVVMTKSLFSKDSDSVSSSGSSASSSVSGAALGSALPQVVMTNSLFSKDSGSLSSRPYRYHHYQPLRGANIAFASDLPRSAGLSSSTALIIAIFTVLSEVNALETHPAYIANIPNREALAAYLGCVENGRTFGTLIGDAGVGTKGGSQDHTAILCSEADHIVGYAYSPARRERVLAMPAGYTFAVGASGVAAEKTGDARDDYNRASFAVSTLLELWRDATGQPAETLYDALTSASAVQQLQEIILQTPHLPPASPASHASHPQFTAEALTARLDQFVLEALQIIPKASDALARGDLLAFGDLVDRSQAAAELWLGNQIPETIALARSARALGAAAASAFGAGFGGSVWALVETDQAQAFIDAWKQRYLATFPQHTARVDFFLTGAGPALSRVGTNV
jgi:galactokinase